MWPLSIAGRMALLEGDHCMLEDPNKDGNNPLSMGPLQNSFTNRYSTCIYGCCCDWLKHIFKVIATVVVGLLSLVGLEI